MNLKTASQIIIVLLVSAMGPYVFPRMGLRTEHFIMYGLVFFFSVKSGFGFLIGKKENHVFILVALFLCLLLVFLVTTYTSDFNPTIYKLIADIENYLQPVWLILITSYCVRRLAIDESINLLINATKTIILLLSLNAAIAISSIFYGTWFLEYFNVAGEETGGWTVLGSAASMGRYTGIFNQPFEAGLAYGVGLISILFILILEKDLSRRLIRPAFLNLGLFGVVVGGVLSVSKVFFPLAIFISFVFFLWASKGLSKKIFRNLFAIAIMLPAFLYFLRDQWSGLDYFLRLVIFDRNTDLLSLFTAGRFAAYSGGHAVVTAHLNDPNLIFGYGLGSVSAPDNAYLEILYFGGVVGVLIYLIVLLALFYFSIKGLLRQPVLAKYLISLLVLSVFAGLGAPVFTVNRANFFLIIPLTIGLHVLTLYRLSHRIKRTNTPLMTVARFWG